MNALRLTQGFETSLFAAHTGQPITLIEKPLQQAEESGLITWTTDEIKPTVKGQRFLDDLVALFIPG